MEHKFVNSETEEVEQEVVDHKKQNEYTSHRGCSRRPVHTTWSGNTVTRRKARK